MVFSQVIDNCIYELNKKENKEKVEQYILDPLVEYIIQKIKPYVFLLIFIFIVTFFFIIYVKVKELKHFQSY